MVLDESALEAMLARQRAAERDHEETPSVRTVKTDEFEVYERQVEETPAAPPARPRAPPRPGPPVQGGNDFEELPGRQPEGTPGAGSAATAPSTPEAAPEPPSWPTAQAPLGSAEPAAPRSHAPPPAEPAAVRRPQVWPPIGRPATLDAQSDPPSPSGHGPAAPGLADPASTPPAPLLHVVAARHEPEGPGWPSSRTPGRRQAPTPAGPVGTADGNGCRLAIVQALFNHEITEEMTQQATARAAQAGAQTTVHQVPGVYDMPLTVQHLARRKDVDAIVVIGCVVEGETKHDELITFTTAKTLQEVALATDTPIALGITGPGMTWQQAQARIGNGAHAVDAAIALWRATETV